MVWTMEPLMAEVGAEWLERLKDPEAFGELVAAYAAPLKRYLTACFRSSADGEELTQETLLRFLESVSSFRGDSSAKPIFSGSPTISP